MKKRFIIMLLALMTFALLFTRNALAAESGTESEITAEGACGDNLTWTLDADSKLTISGAGDMWNYTQDSLPEWTEKADRYIVVVEDGVTSIGDYAFSGSSSDLGAISATLPGSVTRIGNYAFANCITLRSMVLPEGLTSIGDNVFYRCVILASVTFRSSLNQIGSYAFGGCTSLTDVSLPNSVTSIGSHAFDGCSGLRRIKLPSGLTGVSDGMLQECGRLSSIEIPESVTAIGTEAFEYCDALTAVVLPENVTTIGGFAFSDCTSLTSITFLGAAPSIRSLAFYNVTATAHYYADDTWTDSVKKNYGGTITWEPIDGHDVVLSMSQAGGKPDDTVELLVKVEKNPGLSSATFLVNYDKNALELSSLTNLCPNMDIEMEDDSLTLTFSKAGTTYVGDLLTLEFTILEGAEEKAYEVSLDKTDDFQPLYPKTDYVCESGSVNVTIPMVTLSFDSAGGSSIDPMEVVYGTKVTLPVPEKEENLFLGWSDGEKTYTDTYVVKKDVTLTALWEELLAGTFTLSVGTGEGFPGDVVELTVSVTENPGFISGLFPMDFDTSVLTGAGYELLADVGTVEVSDDGIRIEFNKENIKYTGDLLLLRLLVSEDAQPGSYDFAISSSDDFHPGNKKTVFSSEKGTITVVEPPVTDISLDHTDMTLPVFETAQLTADTGGRPAELVWTSDNESVATVDENGVVTAHKYGTAIITVSIPDTGLSAYCEVQTLFWDVADSSKYYFRHVYWAADHRPYAITKGYSLERFEPQTVCSRKDMMTFLWRLAGQPEPTITSSPFPDVTGGYYYKAVLWGVEYGITKGYSSGDYAGMFGIDLPCTREQAMTFLWRMAGKPEPATTVNKFSDVKESDYFYKAVLWASENKIANGYADGTYGVGLPCLREHMVTFLSRYAEKYDPYVN